MGLLVFKREKGGIVMRCAYCGHLESKVLDSRPTDDGSAIRRRRECTSCGKRFTTYERIEEVPLVVVKKDGGREVFDRNKILRGLLTACEKRPIQMSHLEKLVDDIEKELKNSLAKEIETNKIGEMVMEHLRKLDEVAYVRFASVYRQFTDINKFRQELEKLLEEK